MADLRHWLYEQLDGRRNAHAQVCAGEVALPSFDLSKAKWLARRCVLSDQLIDLLFEDLQPTADPVHLMARD